LLPVLGLVLALALVLVLALALVLALVLVLALALELVSTSMTGNVIFSSVAAPAKKILTAMARSLIAADIRLVGRRMETQRWICSVSILQPTTKPRATPPTKAQACPTISI
jgi:cell division septal protein FtsQ